jgi:hypothetical protein
MRVAGHILTILLVFGLLASGLPLKSSEDINRDNRMDLEDAILSIRDLVRTSEEPGSFAFEMETVFAVLNHVAGLKRSIRPVNEEKSKPASLNSGGFYLVPSVNKPSLVENSFPIAEQSSFYESFSLEPATPPPKEAVVS